MLQQSSSYIGKRFHSFTITTSIIYLVIPNIIFLLGWVQPIWSIPISLLLATIPFYVKKEIDTALANRNFNFSKSDIACLIFALLMGLPVIESIGFHGHVCQDPDFIVRNPIYETLIREDWPIFSSRGEYFVYYHVFWLPPAILAKAFSPANHSATLLFIWSYVGFALMTCLLFQKLKKKIIVFALIAGLCESLSFSSVFFSSHFEKEFITLIGNDLNHMLLQSSWLHQLRPNFNHAIPSFICLALLLTKSIPYRYSFIPVGLILLLSPLLILSLLPYILLSIRYNKKGFYDLVINIPNICCGIFILIALAYLSCQKGAGIHLILTDTENWREVGPRFTALPFRLFRVTLVAVLSFLPLLIIHRRLHKTKPFVSLCLFILLSAILWVGRCYNEFLFKGGLLYSFFYAWLVTIQFFHISRIRQFVCVTVLAACAYPTVIIAIPIIHGYKIRGKESYINNTWGGHLNHPECDAYRNFFTEDKYPAILCDKPSASILKKFSSK